LHWSKFPFQPGGKFFASKITLAASLDLQPTQWRPEMIRLIAEYRIKEGTRPVVQNAIKIFVAAVHQVEPETEYISFQVGDSDRFIHLMAFTDEAAQQRHQQADYTSQFVEVLYPNCSQLPIFTPLKIIE
jgi:quinol monooxygenase YgiN